MAKIALRRYIREISEMIDNGKATEAIEHCLLIIKQFPKHLDTYRVLGKAYLESHRFADAEDILKRLLSSRPDDFFAHLGLSIVRENQKSLDDAIWHMERAFEAQPTNTAVEEELRQLYGKRDGIEPPKVRMTRGALVRLYAKGDLLQQGISEARAALLEDPNRLDIQVLLAAMLSKSGRNSEAAELSSLLLSRLPFCFEANRILSDTLPDSAQEKAANPYRERIIAMDPYYGFLKPGHTLVDTISENLVMVEKPEIVSPAGQNMSTTAVGATPFSKNETVEWQNAIPIVEQGVDKQSVEVEEPSSPGNAILDGNNEINLPPLEPASLTASQPDQMNGDTSIKIGTPSFLTDEVSQINHGESFVSDQIDVPETEVLNTKEVIMDGDGIPLPINPADDDELPDWLKGTLEEEASSIEKSGLEESNPVDQLFEDNTNPSEEIADTPVVDAAMSSLETPSIPEWLQEQDVEKIAGEEIPLTTGENQDLIPEWLRDTDDNIALDQTLGELPNSVEIAGESGVQFPGAEPEEIFPSTEGERGVDNQESESFEVAPDSSGQATVETVDLEPSFPTVEDQPEPDLNAVEGTTEQELNITDSNQMPATSDEGAEKPGPMDIEAWRESLQSDSPAIEQEPSQVNQEEGIPQTRVDQENGLMPSEYATTLVEGETIQPLPDYSPKEEDQEPSSQIPEINLPEGDLEITHAYIEADTQLPGDQESPGPILDSSTHPDEASKTQEWREDSITDVPELVSDLEEGQKYTVNENTDRKEGELSGLIEPSIETNEIDGSEKSDGLPGWLSEIDTEKPSEDTVTSWLQDLESQESTGTTRGEGSQSQVLESTSEAQGATILASPYEMAATDEPKENQSSRLEDAVKAIEDGELELAVQRYQSLISENQALTEVIEELKKALDKYPIDINLWQLLGDAYFRDHQIQSALDAYAKAEELIR